MMLKSSTWHRTGQTQSRHYSYWHKNAAAALTNTKSSKCFFSHIQCPRTNIFCFTICSKAVGLKTESHLIIFYIHLGRDFVWIAAGEKNGLSWMSAHLRVAWNFYDGLLCAYSQASLTTIISIIIIHRVNACPWLNFYKAIKKTDQSVLLYYVVLPISHLLS